MRRIARSQRVDCQCSALSSSSERGLNSDQTIRITTSRSQQCLRAGNDAGSEPYLLIRARSIIEQEGDELLMYQHSLKFLTTGALLLTGSSAAMAHDHRRHRVGCGPDSGYAEDHCVSRPRCSPSVGVGSFGSDPTSPFYYLNIQPGPP